MARGGSAYYFQLLLSMFDIFQCKRFKIWVCLDLSREKVHVLKRKVKGCFSTAVSGKSTWPHVAQLCNGSLAH